MLKETMLCETETVWYGVAQLSTTVPFYQTFNVFQDSTHVGFKL